MIEKLHDILAELAERKKRKHLHTNLAIVWWIGLVLACVFLFAKVPIAPWLPILLGVLLVASLAVYV